MLGSNPRRDAIKRTSVVYMLDVALESWEEFVQSSGYLLLSHKRKRLSFMGG